MKKTEHYFAAVITIFFSLFLSACNTVNQTMIDAAVPEEEQSALVVLGAQGNWYNITLAYVDDTPYNARGSIFYIPSGSHTLGIRLTSSSSESDYSKTNIVTTTTWTGSADLKVTTELLPGHTYRMIVKSASDFQIEDISDSVTFPSPKKAPYAPGNGVITNWARPRGFILTPGVINISNYFQYTSLPGKEAKGRYFTNSDESYTTLLSEWGSTGMKAFGAGMAMQGGIDIGFRNFRTSLLAELNGGIGLGGETYEAGLLNWGYLFLAELYHSDYAGIGFGYGRKTAVYEFYGAGFHHGQQQAHKNQFPHFRFELFFNPGKVPVTLFGDYFFEHEGWSAGIAFNLVPKGESPFPKVFLR